jgi:hypothetical protein
VQADNPIGEAHREVHLMQVDDACDAVFDGEGPQLLHDHARAFRVERGNRLVAQDDLRILYQCAGDADALLLSAGKLV